MRAGVFWPTLILTVLYGQDGNLAALALYGLLLAAVAVVQSTPADDVDAWIARNLTRWSNSPRRPS